jgi:hypothetical protein
MKSWLTIAISVAALCVSVAGVTLEYTAFRDQRSAVKLFVTGAITSKSCTALEVDITNVGGSATAISTPLMTEVVGHGTTTANSVSTEEYSLQRPLQHTGGRRIQGPPFYLQPGATMSFTHAFSRSERAGVLYALSPGNLRNFVVTASDYRGHQWTRSLDAPLDEEPPGTTFIDLLRDGSGPCYQKPRK